MNLDDLRWFNPVKLSKYPHLSYKDSFTADVYFESNFLGFESVSYDITVGGGRDALPGTDQPQVVDWSYLSSLKIDMLGRKGNIYTICEFKAFADSGATGQVLTYNKLFIDKFATSKNPLLCVICMFSHPDIIKAANALGVRYLICSTDGPPILY